VRDVVAVNDVLVLTSLASIVLYNGEGALIEEEGQKSGCALRSTNISPPA